MVEDTDKKSQQPFRHDPRKISAVHCGTQVLERRAACGPFVNGRHSAAAPPRHLFEREDALPVVLHADDGPTLLLRHVVHRLAQGADLGVWQSLRRTVGVLRALHRRAPPTPTVEHRYLPSRTPTSSDRLRRAPEPGGINARRTTCGRETLARAPGMG